MNIIFTPLSPVFLTIGPLKFYYYGLMYAISFLIGFYFLSKKTKQLGIDQEAFENFFYGVIIFGLIGARLAHVFFYEFGYFSNNLIEILYVWKGGMASHGGLLGGFIGFLIFKPKSIDTLKLLDLIVVPLPIGLALGRLGNLINGEIYGKVTNLPWCMHFADGLCRHPTQIYAIFKNLFVFSVIYFFYKKSINNSKNVFYKNPGFFSSIFLILYGTSRIIVELFKEKIDGNNYFDFITTGQIFSLVMVIIGFILFYRKVIKK